MKAIFPFVLLVTAGIAGAAQLPASELLPELRKGGYVLFIRHPKTNPDQADTDPLHLDNVKAQRQLSDEGRKQVFAYDGAGNLLAAYPASIGSTDTPSPSGLVNVERVALNPGYTYTPKINFQHGANDKILNIPPGPNGPVGTVWMALSKPTYGIHGTPEPSKIGRTQSHGCIRLTNWDATELAKMVKPGVTVEFVD